MTPPEPPKIPELRTLCIAEIADDSGYTSDEPSSIIEPYKTWFDKYGCSFVPHEDITKRESFIVEELKKIKQKLLLKPREAFNDFEKLIEQIEPKVDERVTTLSKGGKKDEESSR